jgi:Protein of unknown function (DUF1194)
MRRMPVGLIRVLIVLCVFGGSPDRTSAQVEVDLALVLAVDVSRSMNFVESQLQRHGYVEAFRSPAVAEAILGGPLGQIAVAYVEWAGEDHQRAIIPWTVIDSPAASLAFAEALAVRPIGNAKKTSISGAIDFAASLFDPRRIEAERRVIDISGDGANNDGRAVSEARDEAVANGIVINGLAIEVGRQPGDDGLESLAPYFRDCVIGGPGAFTMTIVERDQLARAIRTKLLREISTGGGRRPIHRAAHSTGENCLSGEIFMLERSLPKFDH